MNLDAKAFFEACKDNADLLALIVICAASAVISIKTEELVLSAGMAAVFALIWMAFGFTSRKRRVEERTYSITSEMRGSASQTLNTFANPNSSSGSASGQDKGRNSDEH